MLRINTPVEKKVVSGCKFYVKREDLSCKDPGPKFSKTRGVYARVKSRPESVIGVLDTYHSQAGHAVAMACKILGKKCLNFYPSYKYEPGWREPQDRALDLGAYVHGLPAGRSCILFNYARKITESMGGYMMPNALQLEESVTETAKEVYKISVPILKKVKEVIVPASSATIASGVVKGFYDLGYYPQFIIHLGYSRSHDAVLRHIEKMSGYASNNILIVDEGYSYKDKAKPGPTPSWPCNEYYDLKAYRWMLNNKDLSNPTLFWNIG